MIPLNDDSSGDNHPVIVPPTFQLSHFERPLSLMDLNAIPIDVHFVSGNAQPIVRCNGEEPGECVLCGAGFKVLNRELVLAYDYREDRLWAAPLPEYVWETILSETLTRPEHEWNFLVHWTGRGYCVQHDGSNFTREFTLVQEEREAVQRLLRSGRIDLESAIPRLSSAEMLRLPALLDAARYFGLEGVPDSNVEMNDYSTIHS